MSHVDDGQLNALLDGELDQAEQAEVERHIAACRICRDRLDEARAFLIESGGLLEKLDGQTDRRTDGQRKPADTAREKAIELALPARTAQEPALNIDGRTAKAIPSPFFPQAAERIATAGEEAARRERPPRKWGDVSQLAWAASIVLALGVGYLANEVRILRRTRPPTDMDAVSSLRPPLTPATADTALLDQARMNRQAGGAGTTATAASRSGAQPRRTPLVKPPDARGDKPPDETGEVNIPRERRPARAEELAGASADAAGPRLAAPTAPRVSDPSQQQLGAAANAPPSAGAPGPAGVLRDSARVNRLEEVSVSGVPAAAPEARRGRLAREQPVPPTFRRISADSAIRALSGSIRLVDGMRPERIEVGRGNLIPGANPDREVVRIHYVDSLGRRLVLDQQPGDTSAAGFAVSVNGLMRGDTLVTGTSDGGLRVRWVDRKNFWLSLTGPLSADELRSLVERIR